MPRQKRNNGPDEIDYAILAAISEDASKPDVEIARQVGVSNVTVRNRLRRLIGLGYITIAAIPNLDAFGYALKVWILLKVEPQRIQEVVASLRPQPNIRYISLLTGPFDLILYVHFRSERDLLVFLRYVSNISGVNAVQTAHALETYKIEFGWNPKLRTLSPLEETDDHSMDLSLSEEDVDTRFLDNLNIAWKWILSLISGDIAGLIAFSADDVVLEVYPPMPLAGIYIGKEALHNHAVNVAQQFPSSTGRIVAAYPGETGESSVKFIWEATTIWPDGTVVRKKHKTEALISNRQVVRIQDARIEE